MATTLTEDGTNKAAYLNSGMEKRVVVRAGIKQTRSLASEMPRALKKRPTCAATPAIDSRSSSSVGALIFSFDADLL